ncbi:hypothetical protein BJ944DRAFT_276821 [Cunninghamella echinulata]|nr:hypothetical protein BJ944DRAFT_276821 [Cunninghamella echinulata]
MNSIICPFKDCNKSFSKLANFEKHVMRIHEDQYLPMMNNTNGDKPIRNITPQAGDLEMDMCYDVNTRSNDVELYIQHETNHQSYYRKRKGNDKICSTLSPYIEKVADYAFKYNISHDQYKNLVPLLKDNKDVPKSLDKLKKVAKNDSHELHLSIYLTLDHFPKHLGNKSKYNANLVLAFLLKKKIFFKKKKKNIKHEYQQHDYVVLIWNMNAKDTLKILNIFSAKKKLKNNNQYEKFIGSIKKKHLSFKSSKIYLINKYTNNIEKKNSLMNSTKVKKKKATRRVNFWNIIATAQQTASCIEIKYIIVDNYKESNHDMESPLDNANYSLQSFVKKKK